ncbi:MAG: PAS domain-containing protein, partial [Sphaerochaetaceae bacterium]
AKILEMITKENDILIPMVCEVFTPHDWQTIADGLDEFAHSYVEDAPQWKSEELDESQKKSVLSDDLIQLPSGHFRPEILNRVLNTLPVDITFVDANDQVAYFSQSKERIFPRTTAIIGREVVNCHPPASMHVVLEILDDFKSGRRDMAEFYIHLGEAYVHIRYFAVRDDEGTYLGTLEVTQNIAPIQAITGDKKLLD